VREFRLGRRRAMPRGRLGAEQIVTKLRQMEVMQGQGKSIASACKAARITEQSYYRYRKEYGGLNVDQARRLKQLESENNRLKKLVAELLLEKQVLKDIASGNL
jgi:putative transposase